MEGQPLEVENAPLDMESSERVAEEEDVSLRQPSQEFSNHADMPSKEANVAVEKTDSQKIPSEVAKRVEQAGDTLFRPFWDWNRAAEANGMSPIDKLSEYVQSDFFKNNYEIRERHREAVLNDIMRRYPQCASERESLVTFYNSLFVNKMMVVNNVVYEWQKAAR